MRWANELLGSMPTVQTNDIQTYYERAGEGPPVVFVHGAMVDHGLWAPQVDALADQFTVVSYDVRGHGRTGGSPVDTYSIALFAEDLDALITALDLDRPVICGLSMGGAIAQTYATAFPERLSGLVLADTFTGGGQGLADRLQWAMLRATILPARLFGYERVERVMVRLQERMNRGVSGDYQKIEGIRVTSPPMATTEFAKVVRAISRFGRSQLDLAGVTVPTLVLCGEDDAGFIKRHTTSIARAIPTAELLVVPDAGHASNLDNPAFVTDALRTFLSERLAPAESVGP